MVGGEAMRVLKSLAAVLLLTSCSLADPCGMVPPISLEGENNQIERVGDQKTYVFRKGKVQAVVIHPGFTGNVEEFGMLIPFPEAPELRKVGEKTFDQLDNALDPPTVDFYVSLPLPAAPPRTSATEGLVLREENREDDVVVLKEEAVGMYEVAVLEAGSAQALKRWMEERHFRFPDGMESTCNDYVKQGWCFVAVKTRVGAMKGAQPRPGMRKVNTKKSPDANFDGKVQAMGFRFRSDEFEVPMRLSAFNGGDLHNVVYLLCEEPVRASNLPSSFVRSQVAGPELLSNLTSLLPYRLIGGTEDDLSPNRRKELNRKRRPEPYNGEAAFLFSLDLLAAEQKKLTHAFEETEKQLLDIGETLGLRAERLDSLHKALVSEAREKAKERALGELESMTLTKIEGDFPLDVVANENIRFEPYRINEAENDVSRSSDL